MTCLVQGWEVTVWGEVLPCNGTREGT